MTDALRLRVVLLVAVGGGAGAALRNLIGDQVTVAPGAMPRATLLVNLAGALVLGVIHSGLLPARPSLRPLLAVGILGSFTTFGGLSVEIVDLMRVEHTALAIEYAALSIGGGIGAAWLGLRIGAALRGGLAP